MSDRTDDALKSREFADMRPGYRALLRRLKQQDEAAFAEASRRYAEEVAPALEDAESDPLATWAGYGTSLARALGGGRLVALDETGLATEVDAEPSADPGRVLLFLPDAERQPAITILVPSHPSAPQEEALKLLTR